MSPLRVLRGCVFGALGGLLGWMLIEFLPLGGPFQPWRYEAPGQTWLASPQEIAILGFVLGSTIGGFLGLSEGIAEGTMGRFRRAFLSFLLLGALGGFIGLYFGQILYASLGGKTDAASISPSEFFTQILIRSASWTLVGLFLGIVFGVPNLSFRRMANGALGGALGGFLGGFVFQVLSYTGLFMGPQLRFIGFVVIGASIGFFINLVAEALKRVWVKVLVGRNEGREHVLDTPVAVVGRDELADVPVFLDPSVPKRMATFRMTGGRYALYPEAPQPAILVNGQPLTPGQVLRDGDAIQFGRITLAYFEKATFTGRERPVDRVPLADFRSPSVVPGATPIPIAPNVCEYCGQQRDPYSGACACSVPGAAAVPGGYPAAFPGGEYAPGYAAPPGYPGVMDTAPAGSASAYAATVIDPAGAGYGAPQSYPAEGPRLVVVDGPMTGQVYPLTAAEMGIGREPSQEISFPGDATTSRRHARIFYTPSGWILRDEGSSNGTWIRGARIQEQVLAPGDVFQVGQNQLRFEG